MQASLSDRGESVASPEVSVIVPARNEEACLGSCLKSLVGQEGVRFEVLVVDDGSTDRTPEIARSFAGVKVLEAGALPAGWCGKSNAACCGARQARGEWLLFTDADTVHLPGSLARALAEAKQHGAALLSYSPAQELQGFVEHAVMPVIFAELACEYRPREVSEPRSPAAAANGQYLLIAREAYDAVGGHAAVATSLLEDVELARAVKQSGRRIRFRFGGDAVRARMYRSFAQLREGWTKNLALLFRSPGRVAAVKLFGFVAIILGLALFAAAMAGNDRSLAIAALLLLVASYAPFVERTRRAHAGRASYGLGVFGLPIFSYLLLCSRLYYRRGSVTWKGRQYSTNRYAPRSGSEAASAPRASGAPWST